jgi:hypothetical protein
MCQEGRGDLTALRSRFGRTVVHGSARRVRALRDAGRTRLQLGEHQRDCRVQLRVLAIGHYPGRQLHLDVSQWTAGDVHQRCRVVVQVPRKQNERLWFRGLS